MCSIGKDRGRMKYFVNLLTKVGVKIITSKGKGEGGL